MKFVARAKNGKMLKLNDGKDDIWFFMEKTVAEFVNKQNEKEEYINFTAGDDVIITSEERDGEKFISAIKKGVGENIYSAPKEKTGEDNGKTMYKAVCSECKQECEVPFKPKGTMPITCKVCWAKKNGKTTGTSSSSTSSTQTYGKSPEVNESIKRQAIGHMTARTLAGMKIGVEDVEKVATQVYALYQKLVG